MTVEQMRMQVRTLYTSDTWWNKVDKMTDNQIIAIYHRAREAGRLKEGELVVSYPRHAGREEMMANRIAVDLALGKDVTVIRKNRDGSVVKRDGARSAWAYEEPQIDGYVAKQVTFDEVDWGSSEDSEGVSD